MRELAREIIYKQKNNVVTRTAFSLSLILVFVKIEKRQIKIGNMKCSETICK